LIGRAIRRGTHARRWIALEIEGDVAAVAQRRDHGVTITVADLPSHRATTILRLEAATTVSLRLAAGALTAGDDRGRIVVVDLHTGSVVRDVRVSA